MFLTSVNRAGKKKVVMLGGRDFIAAKVSGRKRKTQDVFVGRECRPLIEAVDVKMGTMGWWGGRKERSVDATDLVLVPRWRCFWI